MNVNVKKLEELIGLVEKRNIEELEISSWGRTIRISKTATGKAAVSVNGSSPAPAAAAPAAVSPPAEAPAAPAPAAPATPAAAPETAGKSITSPIVGTFYRAPSPDASPFVKEGDVVEVGQVVCIVEAMKLMNEIQSDVRGRVAKISVPNGHPVEYGQTLFVIEPV